MQYTLVRINASRFDASRSQTRKMAERFVPLNFIGKLVSPFPAYVFLNLGVHPDVVTFLSMLSVVSGCILLYLGYATAGAAMLLLFVLLDSVDGDMARVAGPSPYGGVLDSFGADIFYGLVPVSVGYYLFQQEVTVWALAKEDVLLVAALVSIGFIMYRLVNAKVFHFRGKQENQVDDHNQAAKRAVSVRGVVRFFELGRHVLVRGNFFSEPGMVFWFFVLLIFDLHQFLAAYLVVLLVYTAVYLVMNFGGAYLYFRHSALQHQE